MSASQLVVRKTPRESGTKKPLKEAHANLEPGTERESGGRSAQSGDEEHPEQIRSDVDSLDGDQAEQDDGNAPTQQNRASTPPRPSLLSTAQVRGSLTFGEMPAPETPARWPSRRFVTQATDFLAVLHGKVKSIVVANLERDAGFLNQLRDQKRILAFHLTVAESLCNESGINLLEAEHTPASIGDLFSDVAPVIKADLTVNIEWQVRPKPHRYQSDWSFNDGRYSDLPVESLVWERTHIDSRTNRNKYVSVCLGEVPLGEVPPDESAPPPKNATRSSNSEITKGVGYDGWLRGGSTLHIIKARSWVFGDVRIGNCDDNFEEHHFDIGDVYLDPFRSAKDAKELHTIVHGYLSERNGGGHTAADGIPFQPTFTLNTFDPADHGLGAVADFSHVVVRFVNHVKLGYKGKDPAQALPWNVQFDIDRADGAGQIVALVRKDLKQWVDEKGRSEDVKAAMRKLFEGPFEKRWRFRLWVLPQRYKNMYRFPTGREGETDGLLQFLDPRLVASEEKCRVALYVEAHIVKIAKVEEDFVFEEIVDEVSSSSEEEWNGILDGDGDDGDAEETSDVSYEVVGDKRDKDGKNRKKQSKKGGKGGKGGKKARKSRASPSDEEVTGN